jgi:UbiA prenyltransferase family
LDATPTHRLRAYLQLMRFPAVFTAVSDVVLGAAITPGDGWKKAEFVWLLGASSGLYLAGMVLNDVFDRAIDAQERPSRPIPSGRVPFGAAIGLGIGLLGIGLACAVASIAVILAALILGYDAALKKTFLGPLMLGGCRLLNVLLGGSASSGFWTMPLVTVASLVGLYVVGVSYFARQEAARSSKSQLAIGLTTIDSALIGLAVFPFLAHGQGSQRLGACALVGVAIFLHVPAIAAFRDPVPRKVQTAVTYLLRAIILIDATMIYAQAGQPTLAIASAALVFPAAILGRWIFIT